MIRGLGIDIVEIERVAKAMSRPRFVSRILTEPEKLQNITSASVAGKWAAKEAVAKAVGTHLLWHDVEILRDGQGKPSVQFVKKVAGNIHLSITHENGIAAAIAVWED
jgi:holo-[acyl-carrier protein] synthase